jgi:hypothetical protein
MALSDSEYERTEFYQDFMRPVGAFHQTAAIISHNDTILAVLSSLRPREAGAYSGSELHLLHVLMPHLTSAAHSYKIGRIAVAASVVRHAECPLFSLARARLTFSKMSAALAVQMKGLGA